MTADLNKSAGTITFLLGGVPCVLKVTWGAIAAIEHDLGCGIVPLARRMAYKDFGLRDLATVILHGLKAADTPNGPTYEKVAELVMRAGVLNPDVINAVTMFCDFALTGGVEVKKDQAAE